MSAFVPARVYPYHYGDSDIDAFAASSARAAPRPRWCADDWYAGS